MFITESHRIHLVGIKGTGMCAMAEFLHHEGVTITGSDTTEVFYTDALLSRIGVIPKVFSEFNINDEIDTVIYSAAYDPKVHNELVKAESLGIRMLSYPQALGEISKTRLSASICGVHGKTTTTGIAGTIAGALNLPAAIIAGGAISSFNNSSILHFGEKILIAETCEYRRHFLNYHPNFILLTSVESDHQDYYPDYASIRDAFLEFCMSLPLGGTLVYCRDDPGAVDVATRINSLRDDLEIVSYGFSENADIRINEHTFSDGLQKFKITLFPGIDFSIPIPGLHTILDFTGAMLLNTLLFKKVNGKAPSAGDIAQCVMAMGKFGGAKRRSEFIGAENNIYVYDDYGHHPTAIKKTLKGFRDFFPKRRIIVDFMSHTYSRTKALFNEFSEAFSDADIVVTHKIYASAREVRDTDISGKMLANEIQKKTQKQVLFFEEPLDAVDALADLLKPGDLFITMGAGNNWQIGTELMKRWKDS
mgnify:CR=1 FL=1